jgi:ribokinase
MGGSGFTASIAAARAGASVALVTYVGDEDAPVVLSTLRRAGVDAEAVAVLPGASGIFVFGTDYKDEAPRPQYRPAEAVPQTLPTFAPASTVLVFGIPDIDSLSDSAVRAGLLPEGTLIWDRQGQLSRTRDARAAATLPARRRIYLANLLEATEEHVITASDGSVSLPFGFTAAVIKDGVHGCLVIEEGESGLHRWPVPAFAVPAGNSIGSGDVFAGVFTAALAMGQSIRDAALYASAGASAVLASGHNIAPPDLPDLVRKIRACPGRFSWRWPL